MSLPLVRACDGSLASPAMAKALAAVTAAARAPLPKSTLSDGDRWRHYRRVQDRCRDEGLSIEEASEIASREAAQFAQRRDEIAATLRSCSWDTPAGQVVAADIGRAA